MFNNQYIVAGVLAICASGSSAGFSAGLTEEGAKEIARVFQPSKSQLRLFSTLAPKQAVVARSALAGMTAPGPATQTFSAWHEFGLQVLAFDHTSKVDDQTGKQLHLQEFGPHRASYVTAKLHLAMYEVANAFATTPGWSWIEMSLPGSVGRPAAGASEGAALAAAARTILNDLYVGDDYHIDAEYLASLNDLGVAATDPGVAFGNKVASLIIGLRANDKSNLPEPVWGDDFVPKAGLGTAFQWEVDPASSIKTALGGNWGMVTPFVSKSPGSYVDGNPSFPPPPSDLTSPLFISALDEVSKCGVDQAEYNEKRDCDLRGNLTNADTYYRAKFWSYDGTAGVCAPVRLYNQIADEILKEHSDVVLGAATKDNDVAADEAKYYAKLNLAMVDSGITAWYAKYEYQYWRPITGIRYVDGIIEEQNPNPQPKDGESWQPLGAQTTNAGQGYNITPPFPSYPSGHSVFGGAFFEVLRSIITDRNKETFSFQSDEFNGPQRLQYNVDAYDYVRCVDDPNPTPQLPTYCKARQFDFKVIDPANYDPNNAEQENSDSRIWMGVHWRFDTDNGIKLGEQVGDDVAAAFK
jgi:hypothetical protein